MITYSSWRFRCNGFVGLWPEPYLEVDGAGVVAEWNPRAEEVFGWRRDEVVGRPAVETLLPAELDDPTALLATPVPGDAIDPDRPDVGGGDHVRFEVMHRSGHRIAVDGRLFVTGQAARRCVGGFVNPTGEVEGGTVWIEPDLPALTLVADSPVPGTEPEWPEGPVPMTDRLTGLPNRSRFERELAAVLARPDVVPGAVGVVVLDIERFRAIDTSPGAATGERVLVTVAERLCATAGAALVARSIGDEFLALFDRPVEGAHASASAFADRARRALARPIEVSGTEIFLDTAVGVALNTFGVDSAPSLLANAASAVYQAKSRRGRSVETYGEPMRIELLDRMTTEHSLHRALERSELMLHYQPVVELSGATTVSVEALIRWQHPDRGLVAPYRFIPVAEESGLIIPIGAWVLEEACRQLSDWHRRAGDGARGSVEVNLSARQIDDPLIIATVEGILGRTGLPPEHLTLEITESSLMRDATSALGVLGALRELGVLLAIDDFGTGYSSLSYLQHFPLDLLKVDRSFVADLGVSIEAEKIVAAVIGLAHALGLKVVAEGVETDGQLDLLRSLGCDLAQGFLFSRPLPAGELVRSFGLPVSA
jgi:diguanylate cyclase (GGDEF)-like protein